MADPITSTISKVVDDEDRIDTSTADNDLQLVLLPSGELKLEGEIDGQVADQTFARPNTFPEEAFAIIRTPDGVTQAIGLGVPAGSKFVKIVAREWITQDEE